MFHIVIVFFVLAFIQGVAEFLPISSSGHLAIFENLPAMKQVLSGIGEENNLLINVALHVATLVAVVIFLRKDILGLIKGFIFSIKNRDFKSYECRMALLLVIASIPAALVGIFLNDKIESIFGSPQIISVFLMINGIMLILTKRIRVKSRKLEEMGFRQALIAGICQGVAVMPGISRSGSTIAGSLLAGLSPEAAAKFSFLMSIPVILGAAVFEGKDAFSGNIEGSVWIALLAAMVFAAVVAFFSVKVLFYAVKKVRLDVFGYYTLLAGAAFFAYFSL
ncbi:MAG TPA: undecaprenyl-diphosphate phosphatase [Spirochaetota bacterium]|nr:undecaprenyl-diphosphate phosphatase [Spirochaetota bacterium]